MNDPNDGTGPVDRWGERSYTLGAMARYAWYNRAKLVRDTVAALAVGLLLVVVFSYTALPPWTFYVALLLAFVAYNRLVSPWERPGDDED